MELEYTIFLCSRKRNNYFLSTASDQSIVHYLHEESFHFSNIQQFLVSYFYFAQNACAFLFTINRFTAICMPSQHQIVRYCSQTVGIDSKKKQHPCLQNGNKQHVGVFWESRDSFAPELWSWTKPPFRLYWDCMMPQLCRKWLHNIRPSKVFLIFDAQFLILRDLQKIEWIGFIRKCKTTGVFLIQRRHCSVDLRVDYEWTLPCLLWNYCLKFFNEKSIIQVWTTWKWPFILVIHLISLSIPLATRFSLIVFIPLHFNFLQFCACLPHFFSTFDTHLESLNISMKT